MKALIVPGILLLTLTGCERDRNVQAAEQQTARPVATESAQPRDVRRQVDVVGTLAAREEVVVSAEVAGRVARLVHDLGDRVAAGAPLVELDSGEAAVSSRGAARGARTGARALRRAPESESCRRSNACPRSSALRRSWPMRSSSSIARRTLPARNLLPQVGSRRRRRRASTTAQAAHEQALASARQLRADIEAQASSLRLAEREVCAMRSIRAPFDGYVAERLVSLGPVRAAADAGHAHRPAAPAQAHRGSAREVRAVDRDRPRDRACASTRSPAAVSRARGADRVPPSTCSRARSRSKGKCRIPTAA